MNKEDESEIIIEYDKLDKMIDAIGSWTSSENIRITNAQALSLIGKLIFLCEKETKE